MVEISVLLVHRLPTFKILDIKRSINLEIIKIKVWGNKHIYFLYYPETVILLDTIRLEYIDFR